MPRPRPQGVAANSSGGRFLVHRKLAFVPRFDRWPKFFCNQSFFFRANGRTPIYGLQVEGGQDKGLQVSGKLPETRCRFVPSGPRGNNANNAATGGVGAGDGKGGGSNAAGSVLDFGRASVGVEIVRTVMLQNTGKSAAVFFVDTAELKVVSASRSVFLPLSPVTKIYQGQLGWRAAALGNHSTIGRRTLQSIRLFPPFLCIFRDRSGSA